MDDIFKYLLLIIIGIIIYLLFNRKDKFMISSEVKYLPNNWLLNPTTGISERDKIFTSGFRSSKSKEFKGSGLGLSLGKKLAEQFGGELKLIVKPSNFEESLPNEGNAFVINFPVK